MADYPRKYWWIVLIAVPIVIALVGLIPVLLEKTRDAKADRALSTRPSVSTTTPERGLPPQAIHADQNSAQNEEVETPSPATSEATTLPLAKSGMIQASGVGFAPAAVKVGAQRSAMARRAAEIIAMRNLTEAIKEAIIQSQSAVRNGELSEDVVRVQVNAVLKLARKVGETENPDGSFTVIMEAPVSQ